MEGKEKLIEAIKKIDFKEFAQSKPVFDEKQLKMFEKAGLTSDEIKTLEEAEMLSQIIELLPETQEGIDKLAAALQAISNTDSKQNTANLLLIAQKDPERLVQLLALTELFEQNA